MDKTRHPSDGGLDALTERMIRVDQAGEYGAARIYAGQLAVLGGRPEASVISEMAENESEHLKRFDKLMNERRVRPTLLSPIWHAAGFALGAATALAGPKTAMACTEAVEQVIEDHYAAQEAALQGRDAELAELIEDARADETVHKDRARAEGAGAAPAHGPVTAAIRCGTRVAIWLSERI
ncbi:MAG TPA: demethoxyubiquinone hydroxylase family protein [Alphaproteobacteria bacterium]|nr:demethoxyubiquinone hydroxylase family protein [Alphaproteobacteria bacterium]